MATSESTDLTAPYSASAEPRALGTCDAAYFPSTPSGEVRIGPSGAVRIYTRLDDDASVPAPHVLAVEQPRGGFLCAVSGATGAAITTTGTAGIHRIWIGATSASWTGSSRIRAFIPGGTGQCSLADESPEPSGREREDLRGYRRRRESVSGSFEDLSAGDGRGQPAYPATVQLARGCYWFVVRANEDAIVPMQVSLLVRAGDGSRDEFDGGYRHRTWRGNSAHCSTRAPRISFCIAHDETVIVSTYGSIDSTGEGATCSGGYTLEVWGSPYREQGMRAVAEPSACVRCRARVSCMRRSPVTDACRERYRDCYRAAGQSSCYDHSPVQ